MKKLVNRLTGVSALFLMLIALVSCSGGGSGTDGSAGIGTKGLLSIGLTDGPPPKNTYDAVYVTIKEISVKHKDKAGWDTLTGPDLNLPKTFNLLDLVNGVIADLGAVELEAGHYNQMRLLLGSEPDGDKNVVGDDHEYANYLILEGEEEQIPLKVPSGYQTGIKLVNGFDIEHKGSTELVLDFDANKSIVKAGKSGKWLLKPTIKVIESVTYSVEGFVEDNEDTRLQEADVNAQIYDSAAPDPKDEVTVAASAKSNDNGYYFMYLSLYQEKYNIVATRDGFLPACKVLDSDGLIAGYIRDFNLTPAGATGTFTGSVRGLGSPDDTALFSIRQEDGSCGMIEVASRSVVNTTAEPADYFEPITLPVGTYEVVVSAEGEVTQVWSIEVAADTEKVLDVFYPSTSVAGTVDDSTDPLPGAVISAYEAGEDLVTTVNEAASGTDGYFFMYLPTNQNSFNILATLEGFVPQCQVLTDPAPDIDPATAANAIDFTLIPVGDTGTIMGSVSGLTTAGSAFFSIRQDLSPCGKLEVVSFSVDEGESSELFTLPAGTYEVVVSAEDEETYEETVVLSAGADEEVVFPPPAP